MMGGSDAPVPANGSSAARSNGSSATARVGASSVTNGTHKSGLNLNGSSNGEKAVVHRSLPADYRGHNREEVTRILIQALSDMGYTEAAEIVSRDSGCELESPTVAGFRAAVLSGSWMEAEQLLQGAASSDVQGTQGNGLVLAAGSDRNTLRFWLRQQKFLELLEQRDTTRALAVLRSELTPLYNDTSKLHFLSSLLMCQSPEDLKAKASWDGANGESRRRLLSELSKCISPSVMLPENRLAVLLQQVKQAQINTCLYHTAASSPSLYCDHFCRREAFPTEVALVLTQLEGEVWQVQFSHDGSMLAACGSKGQTVIWDSCFQVMHVLDGHEDGVGTIAWSPDDTMLVTCSQDKTAVVWFVQTGQLIRRTRKFGEPTSGCVWAKDGRSFVLSSLDKNHSLCTMTVSDGVITDWGKKHRAQDVCGSPDGRWLVAVDELFTIHVYNAETRELEYDMELKERPTSISISEDSRHLLVNKRDGEAQLIDLTTRNSVQKFLGHTGGLCQIRASFGGANESFVVSGSEDGNILIWHKIIGAPVERLPGHEPRCNAVSWKPDDPSMIASCGDDGKVKIWTNKGRSKPIRKPDGFHFVEEDVED